MIGEGDGKRARNFFASIDIIAHEITHGIIQNTSALEHKNESGALNEHLADVFGILCLQHRQGLTDPKQSTWELGKFTFIRREHDGAIELNPESEQADSKWIMGTQGDKRHPGFLRSFQTPHDGVPPQPSHYRNRVQKLSDHGGVHTNSGIPNFAFYTAAIEADGPAWEGVGQPWFQAMIDPKIGSGCSFADFAAATIAQAKRLDSRLVGPILKGWTAVGITCKA